MNCECSPCPCSGRRRQLCLTCHLSWDKEALLLAWSVVRQYFQGPQVSGNRCSSLRVSSQKWGSQEVVNSLHLHTFIPEWKVFFTLAPLLSPKPNSQHPLSSSRAKLTATLLHKKGSFAEDPEATGVGTVFRKPAAPSIHHKYHCSKTSSSPS